MAAPGGPGPRPACRRRAMTSPGTAKATMLPARADPVAARGDADDRIAHRSASVGGSAATRSSAIIPGPARSAARPWSQTAAQAASNAGMPARPQRGDDPGQHVAGPGARQPGRRRRREAEPAVGRGDQRVRRPCRRSPTATACAAASARSALLPGSSPNNLTNSPSCGVRIASWPTQPLGLADRADARRRRSPPGAPRSAPASGSAECRPSPARPGSRRRAGR